jgi:Zn-dependent protease
MKICEYKGIPIRLHISFLILAASLVLFQLFSAGLQSAVSVIAVGLLLFGSVALHEIGHAMMARVYNIKTRSITLYPFGGIAMIEGMGDDERQERNIALAGPAVNFLLAGITVPFVIINIPFAMEFCLLNVLMGAFNLFPAYPMDGGRVLRSIMAPRIGSLRATKIAVKISLIFSIMFCIISYAVKWPALFVIGIFLFITNIPEKQRLDKLE